MARYIALRQLLSLPPLLVMALVSAGGCAAKGIEQIGTAPVSESSANVELGAEAEETSPPAVDAGAPPPSGQTRPAACAWDNVDVAATFKESNLVAARFATPPGVDIFEGPVWIPGGEVWFTGWRWQSAQGLTFRMAAETMEAQAIPSSAEWGHNGQVYDPKAQQIMAASFDTQGLARVDLKGTRTPIPLTWQGKPLNGPNDLALRSDGVVFFTDPTYQRNGRPGQAKTGIYAWRANNLVLIRDDLSEPNGIELFPQEDALLVADGAGGLHRFKVDSNLKMVETERFAQLSNGVDGLAIDCSGRIFAAVHQSRQLVALSPTGKQLGMLQLPDSITNVALADQGPALFITTLKGIYRLPVKLLDSQQ